MRPSLREAFDPLQELSVMSAQGPSNPLGDRPKMAEALASLKEGLRDTADPLYDSWKVRRRPPAPANSDANPPEVDSDATPPAGGTPGDDSATTIDVAFDGTSVDDEGGAHARPLGDVSTVDVSLAELTEPAARRATDRPSVQADTVRVRIIRYQVFPRWALVVAAALVVFAASLVALRAGLPREGTRSTRSVLTSEVPAPFPASELAVAPAPPAVESTVVAPSAPPVIAEAAPPDPPLAPGPPPAPAGKIPVPNTRRRPSGRDFFRDPGF